MNVSIAVDPQLRRLGHDSAAPAASQRRRGRLGRLMEHGPGALLVDRTVESAQNRQQTQTVFAAVQSHPDIRWWRHRLSLSLSLARAHTHTHTLSQNTGTVFLCLFVCFFFFFLVGEKKKKKKKYYERWLMATIGRVLWKRWAVEKVDWWKYARHVRRVARLDTN